MLVIVKLQFLAKEVYGTVKPVIFKAFIFHEFRESTVYP